MASSGQSWFSDEKLLPGEEMVRADHARVRTDAPPFWWDGVVVVTSDRLFFLPTTSNPFLPNVAFWLNDLCGVDRAGETRVEVRTEEATATLRLPGAPSWRAQRRRRRRDSWWRTILQLGRGHWMRGQAEPSTG